MFKDSTLVVNLEEIKTMASFFNKDKLRGELIIKLLEMDLAIFTILEKC